jgi:hypothetical protein
MLSSFFFIDKVRHKSDSNETKRSAPTALDSERDLKVEDY